MSVPHGISNIVKEALLLDSRRRKVPYRQIADRLHKTELACRLHYHQLVVVRPSHSADSTSPTSQHTDPVNSTWCSQSPPPMEFRCMTSPPKDQSVLHKLNDWLDHVRQQRSLSLPIPRRASPLRERCITPPRLDLTKKEHRKDIIAFVTPPTPPTTHQFSPPVSSNSTASTFSVPLLTGHASTIASSSTSPTLLTPSPTLSSATYSSWRGHSTRWTSMDSTRDGLMPSSDVLYAMAPTKVSNSDRCSVHSLLNHDY